MRLHIVSKDQSIKIKQLGFVQVVDSYYELNDIPPRWRNIFNNYNQYDDAASSPTISLALKWLREKYFVHIQTIVSTNGYISNVVYLKDNLYKNLGVTKEFKLVYEESELDGLTIALDIILTENGI